MSLRLTATLLLVGATLTACGDTYAERGISGAAIGAGTAAAIDADPLAGAAVGAGVGVATK